ncbi:hypothetical protein QBC33DRAFT_560498 [Phialemonium atrogriseum]|uniref:Uncharacterized protein n=1 Tax=Phialemonium atrogriseum TaxID=1093897 RepID=A0AAJ0FKX5_9PEZI|nr:uncharacterized protein QBC33DRAFT_560498 [Phialemonium atrogriseum]KAK1766064.1 hypothetical protein QBC33DRAFT_560498 [Phialemonium atrogriseum]
MTTPSQGQGIGRPVVINPLQAATPSSAHARQTLAYNTILANSRFSDNDLQKVPKQDCPHRQRPDHLGGEGGGRPHRQPQCIE